MILTAVQTGFDSRADEIFQIDFGRAKWPGKTC